MSVFDSPWVLGAVAIFSVAGCATAPQAGASGAGSGPGMAAGPDAELSWPLSGSPNGPLNDAHSAHFGASARTPQTGDALELAWLSPLGGPGLSALAREALGANADLAAAQARLAQVRARLRQSAATRSVTIDAGLNAANAHSQRGVDTRFYSLQLNASWEADLWGRLSDHTKAAQLGAVATAADLAGVRLAVLGETASGWLRLQEARALEALADEDATLRARSLALVERRFERGVARALDLRLARSAAASAQASLALRRQAAGEAARRLEVTLGRRPAGAIAAEGVLPHLEPAPAAVAPDALLARRPDVAAAEARLRSARLDVTAARKALAPRLTLTITGDGAASDLAEVFDLDALTSRIAGGMLAAIFRGGALRAEVDAQRAVAAERLAGYARTTLDAWREVQDAVAADMLLAEQEGARAIAAREARRAEALAERQYSEGLVSIFDLLDAQGRRIAADEAVIATRAARAINRVGYHLALGGGPDQPMQDGARARAGSERSTLQPTMSPQAASGEEAAARAAAQEQPDV
jgi:multidrug efflux system outer membrane protein